MSIPRHEPTPDFEHEPETAPTDKPVRAQHEMLRKDIPKKDVAEALEEFDGDEA